MKQSLQKLRTEDWVVTLMGAILLAFSAIVPKQYMPTVPQTWSQWYEGVYLYAVVLVIMLLGWILLGRKRKGLAVSLIFVFAISLVAQIIAAIPTVKFYGFESVFFSVVLGLVISNCLRIPDILKPAIQNEYFIKIGVVCLGATILIQEVMSSGLFGVLQAVVVVAMVWFFGYFICRRFGVDRNAAMVAASGVSICGVSACITAQKVANADPKKLSYIVSIVLIIVVPMIYLMPYLAARILPLIFDDPQILNEVAGAWVGGTIDTTSGVAASSEMISETAKNTAVIVKATQNVLIGVVAFFIALYFSMRGNGKGEKVGLGIVWEKFPKFIIGFVLASLVFSLLKGNDALIDGGKNTAKMFSTLFFSLAFVCVGLETRLREIVSKENRNILYGFLCAQCFNIVVTLIIASLFFGVLKPMLG